MTCHVVWALPAISCCRASGPSSQSLSKSWSSTVVVVYHRDDGVVVVYHRDDGVVEGRIATSHVTQ